MKTTKNYLSTFVLLCLGFSLNAQTIRYVDPKGSNSYDGLSWNSAYEGLQKAIDESSPGDQIWMRAGVHCPGQIPSSANQSDTRGKTYVLKSGVSIYGGFTGREKTIEDRNLSANVTTLSGDIGVYGDKSDNCYHILVASNLSETTVIDGIVITEGNANSNSSYIINGQEILNNHGGGLYNTDNSSPLITNVTFENNNAEFGGGLFNDNNSNPSLSRVIFIKNTADVNGAGMNNMGGSSPEIRSSFFVSNVAKKDGGAIKNNTDSDMELQSVVFFDNCAVKGGAIANDGASPNLVNVDFYKNIVDITGGAMYNENNSEPTMVNSILWENMINNQTKVAGADLDDDTTSATDLTFSVSQLNSLYSVGTEILNDINPLFIDPTRPAGPDGKWGTQDDGLRLQCSSPIVNIGQIHYATVDASTNLRFQGNKIDFGAYESSRTTAELATSVEELAIPILSGFYNSERTFTQDGWTHFCTCDNKILVSLDLNSTNAIITDNGAGIEVEPGKATFYPAYTGFVTNPKGAAIINRIWTVNPIQQPDDLLGLKFYFLNSEFEEVNALIEDNNGDALTDVSQMKMFKSLQNLTDEGVESANPNLIVQLSNSNEATGAKWTMEDMNNYLSAEYKVSTLTSGGAGGASAGTGILPVEMVYFNAQKVQDHVLISWATSSEVDNKGFIVQHSLNGVNFVDIGWVKGNGTTTQTRNYEFEHLEPQDGYNFYRLIQEDLDGVKTISHVYQLKFDKKPTIEIYPNPAINASYVNLQIISQVEETAEVKVFSLLDGKHEFTREQSLIKGKNEIVFDIEELKSGIYSVILYTQYGQQTGVIIK